MEDGDDDELNLMDGIAQTVRDKLKSLESIDRFSTMCSKLVNVFRNSRFTNNLSFNNEIFRSIADKNEESLPTDNLDSCFFIHKHHFLIPSALCPHLWPPQSRPRLQFSRTQRKKSVGGVNYASDRHAGQLLGPGHLLKLCLQVIVSSHLAGKSNNVTTEDTNAINRDNNSSGNSNHSISQEVGQDNLFAARAIQIIIQHAALLPINLPQIKQGISITKDHLFRSCLAARRCLLLLENMNINVSRAVKLGNILYQSCYDDMITLTAPATMHYLPKGIVPLNGSSAGHVYQSSG